MTVPFNPILVVHDQVSTGGSGAPSILSPSAGTSTGVDSPKAIGDRIRERRVQLKLTQDELGTRVGVPGGVVSRHERGTMGVGAARLLAYAQALEITVEWLTGNAELAKPGPKSARVFVSTTHAAAQGSSVVPRAIVALLNDCRCNPLLDSEIAHLNRYLSEGGSEDIVDLEIQVLLHRAGRDQTDEAIEKFRSAVRRKRKPSGEAHAHAVKRREPHTTR